MREILFRGKRTDNGEWVYGNYNKVEKLDNSGYEFLIIEIPANFSTHSIIPETVGQYTGLNANGKKVFEGDVLHVKAGKGWTCPEGTDIYYEVVFTEFNEESNTCCEYIGYMAKRGEFNLTSICYLVNSHGAKVIGNIHDNPELLKGK